MSTHAVRLAEQSKAHNIQSSNLLPSADHEVSFRVADVLGLSHRLPIERPAWRRDESWDVVISNPPYISEADFRPGGSTTRSVRGFEPKLALVPPEDPGHKATYGDIFYRHIVQAAIEVNARVIVMEVGDSQQASRVWTLADTLMKDDGGNYRVELWRDDGTITPEPQARPPGILYEARKDAVDRAVVIWRHDWVDWRKGNSI